MRHDVSYVIPAPSRINVVDVTDRRVVIPADARRVTAVMIPAVNQ